MDAPVEGARRPDYRSKVKPREDLVAVLDALRADGRKVVFTNGCFDVLHRGHAYYLWQASLLGDCLVVGVNSDESVRALKGPTRPVMPEAERAELVAALEFVDFVVIFAEANVVPLLRLLRPEVYVKGGDYTIDTINQQERRVVEEYGGRVHILGHIPGTSTTDVIARIKNEVEQ
jgi:rfaE bifunctional protein nucleotidyltransferase chain/domain